MEINVKFSKQIAFAIFVIFFATQLNAQMAKVQVIHNSADPAAAVVDVYVNGLKPDALDDFAFRSATPFLDVPAGTDLTITIAGPGSMDVNDQVVANIPAGQLEADKEYILVANGVVGDGFSSPMGRTINFALYPAEGKSTSEMVDLKVFHGSTDAPAVDIYADINGEPLIPNLNYGDYAGYLTLPVDVYNLTLTVAGAKETVAGTWTADITGLDGLGAVVFASGFFNLDDQPETVPETSAFGLYAALPNGTVVELPVNPDNSVTFIEASENTLFPNPANDYLNISEIGNYDIIEIFNMNGEMVMNFAENNHKINISVLAQGTYLLKSIKGDTVKSMKFVVVN